MDHSRFYENIYEEEPPETFLNGRKLKSDLVSKMNRLEEALSSKLESVTNIHILDEDYSVYTGYLGVACLYILKYRRTSNLDYLQKAKVLTDKALLNLKFRSISFLLGDAGPLALGAVIANELNDNARRDDLVSKLCDLPQRIRSYPPYEVLYGYSGYLYSLLYLKGSSIESENLDNSIKWTVKVIIDAGRDKAAQKKSPAPLYYEWYDTNYLGAAHGLAGILYMLLCANEYLSSVERRELIKPTIDWLSENRFTSGNFKASEGKDRDSLVQWCHGSPGFVYLYVLASRIFKNELYMKLALQCGDVTWHRGLLRKGYSICHGVSGNAYTFLYLFQATGSVVNLHRAACFGDWCTSYPKKEGRKPDSPYSLFEGIAGVAYFLNDCNDPQRASFPAFSLA